MRCCFSLLLLCLLLICCESDKRDLKNVTIDGLYKESRALLKAGNYSDAAKGFKEIDELFPYSSKAGEGVVLSCYCYFLSNDYIDATRGLEIFIKFHPSHCLIPYAMYLKAMCIYMQVPSIGRDSKLARKALEAFRELVNRFPGSAYHADCLKKIMLLNDIIAAHEMMIGRFYQNKKNMLSAINRYRFVVERMPNTNYTSEALYRSVECFMSLGMRQEAVELNNSLHIHFPNNKWSLKAKKLLKIRVQ